ncbi:MAG: flagellar hook-basal body complex protein FliE [Pseudomonadota bacterium]
MNSVNSLMSARNAIIQQNKAIQNVTNDTDKVAETKSGTEKGPDFVGAMQEAVQSVNALQQESAAAATAYEMGETTDIAAVMLAKQKASVGFEATMQVRNKLLSAYQDIMNMPV